MLAQEILAVRDRQITTMFGRTIKLVIRNESENTEHHIRNMGKNFPVQAGAAEIFKRTMLNIAQAVPEELFMLQVHDEILLDGDWRTQVDWEGLSHAYGFWTPMEVSVLDRWQ